MQWYSHLEKKNPERESLVYYRGAGIATAPADSAETGKSYPQ